jgi:hypothetical protein
MFFYMSLRVVLSITHCLRDSSVNQSKICEQRINSGIKQLKLPQVPHFRKDWSPPRRLLVRFNVSKCEIRPIGEGKVHVLANENIASSAGKISFLGKTEDASSKGELFLVLQIQVDASFDSFTKNVCMPQ